MKSIASMLPMRDTTEWPGYREARWIPLRFGPCGGEALQYDDSRTVFVWNGLASVAVRTVTVAGQRVANWIWDNAPDVAGRALTFIRFSEPVPEGAIVIARGFAAVDPVRGGLMSNAADVLWFLLSRVGELPLPAARFAAFRQQVVDLPVGGSVEQPDRMYAIARSICASIGAISSADMLGFARLWPSEPGAAAATVGPGDMGVSSTADLSDLCTDLTLRYAFEAGTPRGAVQYVVARTPAFGAQPDVVDAPWVSTSRAAARVCERLLQFRAREQYVVQVTGYRGTLRVGQAVELAHPRLPVSGTHTILQRETSVGDTGELTAFTLRAAAGTAPVLRLVRNTNASEPVQAVELVADQLGDEFVVDVEDEAGNPIPDADCTLDGVITRRADSAGRVKFPSRYATRGEHELVATAPGRDPVTILITVR